MPFTIIRNDITKLSVDAIVNAANTQLLEGGGVCGAIFAAAGAEKLQAACDALAPIETGEAVITDGFDLPAKFIIHTAGPVYVDGTRGEEELLRSCYINSLELAVRESCESVAFPLISSGIYGYPRAEALRVATEAIRDFLSSMSDAQHTGDIDVTLVVFDKESFQLSEELLGAVNSYISEHYVKELGDLPRAERSAERRNDLDGAYSIYPAEGEKDKSDIPLAVEEKAPADIDSRSPWGPMAPRDIRSRAPVAAFGPLSIKKGSESLAELVGNLDEPFTATLLRLIDAKGMKDSQVYHRANLDRRLFSKIRSNMDYSPSKGTVIALAVSLELTLPQTADLLARAGFALSKSRVFDVIVEYFISNSKYDIFEINEVLFSYDQPLLGGT